MKSFHRIRLTLAGTACMLLAWLADKLGRDELAERYYNRGEKFYLRSAGI